MLAPASSDQITLLNLTAADKKLEQLPEYKELLQTFITQEVCSTIILTLNIPQSRYTHQITESH